MAICPTDWSLYRRHHEQIDPRLYGLVPRKDSVKPLKQVEVLKSFNASDVSGLLGQLLNNILEVDTAQLDDDLDFIEIGLDSIYAQRFALALKEATGLNLEPPFLQASSLRSLSQALQEKLRNKSEEMMDEMPETISRYPWDLAEGRPRKLDLLPVHVLSLGVRTNAAASQEEFWLQVLMGAGVSKIPSTRKGLASRLGPEIPELHGGFLEDLTFDWAFFGIQHMEARLMDPQQALLMEAAFHATQGLDLLDLHVGVWVGIGASENLEQAAELVDCLDTAGGTRLSLSGVFAVANNRSAAASRLSRHFGWRGPSMAIDTACSSSLFAVDGATQQIRFGKLHSALGCGVNVILSPVLMRRYAGMGMLSPTGSCRSFDESADGIVRSEGCGALMLGRRISESHPEILGGATNNNGSAGRAGGGAGPTGIMWPSGRAQQELLHLAMQDAGVQQAEMGFIEAHGTGTALGDPVEAAAFSKLGVIVGAGKSVLGHHEAAAGIMGVLKSIHAFGRAWPSNQHLKALNPHIDAGLHGRLSDAPSIQFCCSASPIPVRSIVGVSSFGFSGSNAHVVLTAGEQNDGGSSEQKQLWSRLQSNCRFLKHQDQANGDEQNSTSRSGPYLLPVVASQDALARVCSQLGRLCRKARAQGGIRW